MRVLELPQNYLETAAATRLKEAFHAIRKHLSMVLRTWILTTSWISCASPLTRSIMSPKAFSNRDQLRLAPLKREATTSPRKASASEGWRLGS